MAKKGSVNLSILSTYDSKGTDQGEKALKRFAKQFGEVDKESKQLKLDPVAEQLARQSIAADEYAQKLEGVAEKTGKIGKTMSVGVTAPVVAAGAAVSKTASDYQVATSKIRASLGATEEEAERFSKIGQHIYEDGWGESLQDVTEALIQTKSTIRDIDDHGLEKVTKTAMVLSDTLGADVNETIRGTNALMEGFGLTADQASDLMAAGMQRGLNYTDELGDNLAEYSVRWGKAGVSASSYFSLLEAGASNGAYNLDKVGDFLNEFLTSLSDGRLEENMGKLSSGTRNVFEQFKAGKATAQDVLNAVIGDMKGMKTETDRAALASTLWSSLGEDNAMSMIMALGNVQDSYSDVAGSADSLAKEAGENLPAKISSATRDIMGSLEPLGDPIVDAAGDVAEATHQFSEWFAGLDDGSRKTILMFAGVAAASGPAITASSKLISAGAGVVKGYSTLTASMAAVKAGAMANGDALTTQAKVLGKTGNAVTGFVSKMGAARLGAIGLAAVVGGVAIKAYVDYREHQDKVTKATDGLRNAQSKAMESAKKSVSVMQAAGGSAQDAATKASVSAKSWRDVASSVDSVIDSQAQLTDSIQQTFEQAYTTTGQLDSYMATIDELANKSNLTEGEQSRLTNAVKDLNEACGTGYEVTDALNGKIKDEEGNVLKTTDAIHKLVEAKKLEIQVDAVSAAAKEAYEQREQAARAVADAEQLLNDKIAARDALQAGDAQAWQTAQAEVDAAQQKLNEAKGAYDAAAESCASFDDQLNLLTTAQRKGTDTTQAWLAEHSDVVAVFANSGKSAVQFADKLSALGWKKDDMNRLSEALADTGLSMTDLAGLSDEALAQLVNDFDGSFDSILASCQKEGTKIPKEFADKINQNSQKVKDASSRMSREASNAATQNADGTAAGNKLSNTAAGGISALASKPFGAASSMIGNAVNAVFSGANGTSAGSRLSSTTAGGINTTAANGNAAALGKNAYNSAAGKMDGRPIGANFAKGLANGIAAEAWRAGRAAIGVASDVVGAVIHRWDQHSPSKVAQGIGENWTKGLAIGEEKEGPTAVRSAVDVADSVIAATADRVSAYNAEISIGARATQGVYSMRSGADSLAAKQMNDDIGRIADTLFDILAEVKRLPERMGKVIRENTSGSPMSKQQQARYVQKLVAMNV